MSESTARRILHGNGIRSNREEFKFILTAANKVKKIDYCWPKLSWKVHKEWANYGFTDEMSIEVGGMHGASCIRRSKTEC